MGTAIGICAHGHLSEAILEAAAMVAGVPDGVKAFPLLPGIDPFAYRADIEAFLDEHVGNQVLLLVDLFGGTPSNMAATFSGRENVQIVAGLNLPMLIEVMTRKDQVGLVELRDMALAGVALSAVDVKERFAALRSKKEES